MVKEPQKGKHIASQPTHKQKIEKSEKPKNGYLSHLQLAYHHQ